MILERLLESLNQFEEDSTNYKITHYVLNHIDDISHQSIDEVAQHCFISKSALSKYVKKIGYQSYSEFKEECYMQSIAKHVGRCDITYQTAQHFQEFHERLNDNIHYFASAFHSYNQFIHELKQQQLIYVYAQGDSRYLCYYLQYQLGLKGKSVVICDIDEFIALNWEKESMALVLSSLGNSLTMSTRLMDKLKKHAFSWIVSGLDEHGDDIHYLHIPALDKQYSDIMLKLALDYIISEL